MIDYISREDAKLHIFEYGVRHRDNGSIASACENLERQMNSIPAVDVREVKWIPVTERLPEVFKHVLVNIPGMSPHPTVQEAFREKNGMWYSNGFRYEADEITHWMPLPTPPKEET